MKDLWAPWRMEYILAEKTDECFICEMLRADNDRANLLLKRSKTCAMLMNRYPYNNGHLMIAPNRHIHDMPQLNAEERLETMDLVAEAIDMLRAVIRPDGFNIGVNLGKIAGAGLETHIHTHIVPRWNGDTNFMPVIADVKVIPQALDDLYQQLADKLG